MPELSESVVASAGTEWKAGRIPGISVKVLRRDEATGQSSSLVRFDPGAKFPAHDHPAGEEVYVLQGEVQIGRHRLKAGDYLYAPPGVKHAASSESGCVFLVALPKPVVILEKA
jgi:quercetin dioxygenase-like cupin family protein